MAFLGRGQNGDILQIVGGRSVYGPLQLAPSGFVVGPAAALDSQLMVFDGATGKLAKAGDATLSGGDLTLQGALLASGNLTSLGSAVNLSGVVRVPEGRLLPLTVREADGSPVNTETLSLIFPNASLVSSGTQVQVVFPTATSGTVVGPVSSTDNALVRWDGTAGVSIQNSNAILTDAGDLTLAGSASATDVNANRVIRPQTIVSSAYAPVTDSQYLVLTSGSADQVILPPNPVVGQQHIVKDAAGTASSSQITILGSGDLIDGVASVTLINDFEALGFIYNGAQWSII